MGALLGDTAGIARTVFIGASRVAARGGLHAVAQYGTK
jgi:hypothetical protein